MQLDCSEKLNKLAKIFGIEIENCEVFEAALTHKLLYQRKRIKHFKKLRTWNF